MKKMIPVLLVTFALASCNNNRNVPDVSAIPVNVTIERFDKAFFKLDSNNIVPGLIQLNRQFPYFTNDFVANILGAGFLSDTNKTAFIATRQFLTSYQPVNEYLQEKFDKLNGLEKELKRGFQFVKYYFPKYQLPPKVVSYIGPFDAPGVALTRYTLAIGLQLYGGKNFSFYQSEQGQQLYPAYISRRFEPAYIPVNCMKAISEDLFQDDSGNKPLIDQMIEKGKYWWLVNQFLPETADTLITGFTQKQSAWCKGNEGMIWNFFLQGDLYSIDPDYVKAYIGDAPNTQGMPDASPGNIGAWVGWQIVKKYTADHSEITPEQLMRTDARKIFQEAKYKPK
ncbi:MAG: hypothetical protein JST75_14435 [Bacteroidetes bacterium]|nr:hypothetical protein [Bacteroidota bacterium]